MAKEKPSQNAVDRMIDRLSHLKSRHRRVTAISRIKNIEEWPDLKALLQDFINQHDKSFKGFSEYGQHLDDHERVKGMDHALIHKEDFEYIIQLIEKPEDEAIKLSDSIEEIERDIASKREELKEFGLEPEEARS